MPHPPPLSYVVECSCGGVARGERSATGQVIRCGRCQRELFIFPVPPLPAELSGGPVAVHAPMTVRSLPPQVRFWLPPVAAGLAALGVVAGVVAAIVSAFRVPTRLEADEPLTAMRAATRLDTHEQIIRSALADGSFRLAARELDAARKLHRRFPEIVNAERREQFRQWQRQSAILADLLAESLGEIFQHSLGMDEREWQVAFHERYAGKACVLDGRVWRDASGRYQLDYRLDGGGLAGEWDLQAFALFQQLPLAQPQRLLFGARLAEVARNGRQRWRVRFLPESGVLITDPSIVTGLALPLDDEMRAVLRRQAGWAADLAGTAEGW